MAGGVIAFVMVVPEGVTGHIHAPTSSCPSM